MTKSDIKDYMIVETGYDGEKFIVLSGTLVDDELNGFSLDEFDENLINLSDKPHSISKVYEAVDLRFPFELNIKHIFNTQKPRRLWKREPTSISKRVLEKMKQSELQQYLSNIVYPCIIVE